MQKLTTAGNSVYSLIPSELLNYLGWNRNTMVVIEDIEGEKGVVIKQVD